MSVIDPSRSIEAIAQGVGQPKPLMSGMVMINIYHWELTRLLLH